MLKLNVSHSQTKKPLVHHMTLFECSTSSYPSSDPASWDIWVKSSGAVCNSNLLTPRDWDACITPVAVWTISSTGLCWCFDKNSLWTHVYWPMAVMLQANIFFVRKRMNYMNVVNMYYLSRNDIVCAIYYFICLEMKTTEWFSKTLRTSTDIMHLVIGAFEKGRINLNCSP